jgi:hypothetical protein
MEKFYLKRVVFKNKKENNMSIEKNIERIAEATEQILKVMLGVKVVEEKKAVEPVKTVSTAKEIKSEMKEPTDDDCRNIIREYMNATDKDKAIAILVAFGAKAEKPMIKDVTDKSGMVEAVKKALAAIESGA